MFELPQLYNLLELFFFQFQWCFNIILISTTKIYGLKSSWHSELNLVMPVQTKYKCNNNVELPAAKYFQSSL